MLTDVQREKIKYLSQYRYINAEIDRKIREIENMKSKIYNITGTLSDMPKSHGRNDTIADCISKINDFENNINAEIDRLLEVKIDIEKKINSVRNPQLREIMKARYIDCKRYEQIAVDMVIDLRWLYRLHERALDQIKIDH
jgi:hypothetical protein